jgi:hypothetical protein
VIGAYPSWNPRGDRGTLAVVHLARACVGVGLFVAGCGPRGADAEGPTLRTPEVVPAAVPAFLELDDDLAARHPRSVRIARAGAVRLEHDGHPLGDASGRSISNAAWVLARLLDEDAYGTPSRPRVLCESEHVRVAVVLERDDLATVAARRMTLGPTPGHRPTPAANSPGITVRAGTVLRVEGSADAEVVRVVIDRPGVRASGFARGADVGIDFVPEDGAQLPHHGDARLVGAATIRSMPGAGGVVIAELDPRLSITPPVVTRLGAIEAGSVPVQVAVADLEIVGWIDAAAITPGATVGPGASWSGRGPSADVEGPSLAVTRGALLRGGPLRHAVGIVTADARFACVAECDGATPRIAVPACTTALELWVDRGR